MKIGFDAKRYFHNATGLGNYSRDLVNGLCEWHKDQQYFLFDKQPDLKKVPQHAIAVSPQGSATIWREFGMRKEMALYGLNVYHGLSNELPFGKFPAGIKKIVTIHDVIFKLFPEHYALIDRSIYDYKTRHAIKIADTIVATSKATANDLIKFYGANEAKIKVVYQTCGNLHKQTYNHELVTDFKIKYALNTPYILYVSSFQTRKNHLPLIKAFAALKQNNIKLVLAGRKGETYNDCVKLITSLGLQDIVNLVDDIASEDLPLLYRGAQGFVYPSMIEGFGIPLIEAAHAGVPMAVNDIAVFREIAPEGTLFFDVNDSNNLSESLRQLIDNYKGRIHYEKHLELFDVQKISQNMIQIYAGNN